MYSRGIAWYGCCFTALFFVFGLHYDVVDAIIVLRREVGVWACGIGCAVYDAHPRPSTFPVLTHLRSNDYASMQYDTNTTDTRYGRYVHTRRGYDEHVYGN